MRIRRFGSLFFSPRRGSLKVANPSVYPPNVFLPKGVSPMILLPDVVIPKIFNPDVVPPRLVSRGWGPSTVSKGFPQSWLPNGVPPKIPLRMFPIRVSGHCFLTSCSPSVSHFQIFPYSGLPKCGPLDGDPKKGAPYLFPHVFHKWYQLTVFPSRPSNKVVPILWSAKKGPTR
jgi:hypothetical protein